MIPECVLDFLFNVVLVNLVGIGIAVGTTIEDGSHENFRDMLISLLLTVVFWPIAIGMALRGRHK